MLIYRQRLGGVQLPKVESCNRIQNTQHNDTQYNHNHSNTQYRYAW
jgi:hypothetical protein